MNGPALLPLKSKLYQYADDTALALANEHYDTAVKIMQSDIHKVMTWRSKSSAFVNNKNSN